MRLTRLVPGQISAQLVALMVFAVLIFHLMMSSVLLIFPNTFVPPQMHYDDGRPVPSGALAHGRAVDEPPSAPFDPSDMPMHQGLPHPPIFGRGPLLATFLFLSISLGVLGLWAARALVAPLKKFVLAAEHYRAGGRIAVLAEEGPTEIRSLARALNEMQARITELMAERTRMLAAIGHDLRTPITRLRLRAEFMPNAGEQRRMLADLDHMEALVRAALIHLQDGKTVGGLVPTDLPSLLQTVSDQFCDLESEVAYSGPQSAVVRLNPHEFQRAVSNLVENAVRYGESPRICLVQSTTGDLEVRVEDSGPGISDGQKATMLEPFTRGDTARTMNEFEGFGLGLAIAQSIAEAHGGRLDLRDHVPRGLSAVIVLPVSTVVQCEA
jgi:signal transduction histidine kinase